MPNYDYPAIHIGDKSSYVAKVQRALNKRAELYGLWKIVADGEYGPLSQSLAREVIYKLGLYSKRINANIKGIDTYAIAVIINPGRRNATQLARSLTRAKEPVPFHEPTPAFTKYVRNYSGRGGKLPVLIVLHSTESHNRPGISDLEGVADWFNNKSSQASSHVVNDEEGNSARLVRDEHKAWTVAAFNPISLNIEQVGFASQGSWPHAQIRNTAEWVAYWSRKWNIPIRHSTRHGICYHSDLGQAGGGHHDPGPGYPLSLLFQYAKELV